MKKIVIFHICALPQLYVKVGKIFWIRAWPNALLKATKLGDRSNKTANTENDIESSLLQDHKSHAKVKRNTLTGNGDMSIWMKYSRVGRSTKEWEI